MFDVHLDAVFLMYVFCQMLCGIDATVLSAGASEGEHQTRKASLNISLHMGIGQLIHTL